MSNDRVLMIANSVYQLMTAIQIPAEFAAGVPGRSHFNRYYPVTRRLR